MQSSLSPPLCCVSKLGWRMRKLTCNKPVTDEASLRNRQEDIWQGLDAGIKSQEMHSASSPCHVFFVFLVSSFLALPFPLCSITSSCPSSFSLPLSFITHFTFPLPLPTSPIQLNCDILRIDSNNKTETKCKCAVLVIAVQF